MRIKIITCHDVYNFGASLQAYALMKYLQQQNHNVEIIDYKPDYLSQHYNLLAVNNPDWNTTIARKAVYLIAKFPGRVMALRRKYAFDRFTKNYLHVTPVRYSSNQQLKENPPGADIFICGSDQIWNCFFPNGKDPAFYLDFVPRHKRKISYAASFAVTQLPKECEKFVKDKTRSLDYISVRERSGLKILEGLGIKHGRHVLDPAFLLSRQEWDNLCGCPIKGNYVLVYDFDRNDLIKEIAYTIARKQNLQIYSVNEYKCNYAHKNFPFAEPSMFLSLIKNAAFIISNSLHGTIFSIIFEKNFCVVNRRESINARMADLLSILNLEDRLVTSERDMTNIIFNINYQDVNSKLQDLIWQSKEFLHKCVS